MLRQQGVDLFQLEQPAPRCSQLQCQRQTIEVAGNLPGSAQRAGALDRLTDDVETMQEQLNGGGLAEAARLASTSASSFQGSPWWAATWTGVALSFAGVVRSAPKPARTRIHSSWPWWAATWTGV